MLLILFGRIGQFLIAFAGIRLATTLLTPAEMGRMALVLAITSGFALTLVNPVGMFINRRLHAWELLGRATGYLRLYWLYLALVSVASAVILYAGVTFGLIDIGASAGWLIVLVSGSLLFNSINQTYIPSLNLLGHPKWFVALTLTTQGLSLIIAVIFVLYGSANAEHWLLGLLAGQAVLGLVGMRVFDTLTGRDEKQLPPDPLGRKYRSALLGFAWPLSVAVGLGWLQSQGYRFFLEDAAGLAQLGLFVAGYTISAGIIAAFESVLTTYFQPKFYRGINAGNIVERTVSWNAYAAAIFPALIVTVLFISGLSRELSRLFLGPSFQDAAQFILWGALAEAIRVVAGTFALTAHAQMQTRLLILPNAAGALLSLALAWFLIPIYDGIGAGIALVASGSLLVAILNWQAHRDMAIKLPYRRALFGILAGSAIMLMAVLLKHLQLPLSAVGSAIVILGVAGLAYVAVQFLLIAPLVEHPGNQT